MNKYTVFFRQTTGHNPYPYQVQLAASPYAQTLINVPTALGKTAAVVLAWLWRRRFHPDEQVRAATPRRLVYCLPMRVLVDETAEKIEKWLDRLGLLDEVGLHVLMGGKADESSHLDPLKPAIIVGTQDMILSRLLNRGYAMNPLRWPVPFGLLANDALWLFDEVQLLGDGLATSLQLQAFREDVGAFRRSGCRLRARETGW